MKRVRLTIATVLAVALFGAGETAAVAAPIDPAGPGGAASTAVRSGADAATAGSSRLGASQRRARRRESRRCRRTRSRANRRSCLRRVKAKFRRLARRQAKPRAVLPTAIHRVLVTDNTTNPIQSSYFIPYENIRRGENGRILQPPVPATLTIGTGEAVRFIWDPENRDSPHTIAPWSFPPGVNRLDFSFLASAALGVTFQRTFTVPGRYTFVCSLHQETQILELTVNR